MLISMLISVYSTRLILNALGVNDFGIFNLVAGVIAMLSFMNGAMSTATQRFLSYYLGSGEIRRLVSVFNSSVILHLLIAFSVVIILELGGLILFKKVLNIPIDRVSTAKMIFHFMVISTFFTINSVPYDALISAHENFLFDAFIGILESIIKLGIAIFLLFTKIDKLLVYGLLIACLTIFMRIIKSIYCSRKYSECRIHFKSFFNFELFKEMLSFASWNLFGSLCAVIRNQGIAVVLNIFLGVVVNAAYGIANQVNGLLNSFSQNMLKALTPQIIKSEGSNDRNRMLRLSTLACSISYLLFAFFAVPLIIEMPYILQIWLKTIPDNTIIFCQLILILTLIQQLTIGLMSAIQSIGIIKNYQIVVGTLLIFNLPFAYLLIKLGFPAYFVLISSIVLEVIALFSRIWFAHNLAGLDVNIFLRKTLLKPVLATAFTAIVAMVPHVFLKENLMRTIITLTISTFLLWLSTKYVIFSLNEYNRIKELFYSVVRKSWNTTKNFLKE